jgi:type II secretion system protein J
MTRRTGFTLVELMLAILILAILMTIIYGVVVSTVQAQRRIEEISESSEIGPAILTQIRSDLEAAFVPVAGSKEEADQAPDPFLAVDRKGSSGDRDRIDLLAAVPAYGAEREGEDARFHTLNEVGYQVLDSREEPGVGILYRREDFGRDADPLRGGFLTEMYDRVQHFNLSFWDGERWRAEWSVKKEQGRLPRAIRIDLRLLVRERDDANVPQAFSTILTFVR